MRRRAHDIVQRIPEYAKIFDTTPIELGSETRLPLGYEAGHAFGRRYLAGSIDSGTFYDDLEKILHAYEALIDRGGLTPTDTMKEELPDLSIEETRKYFLSKRIERSSSVRPRVFERRGVICEACGLDPVVHMSFGGPLDRVPLDVHHSFPIKTLQEGESRRYKIPDDFLVLCPTCHRMIHMQDDPSDIDSLKASVRFLRVLKKKN